jgi:hypothetical protein
MIRLSNARLSDRVTIIGRGELGLLLELSRRGFAEAACIDPSGPRASGEAEILWIATRGSDAEFATMLARFERSLRPGGVILVHEDGSVTPAERGQRIRALRRFLLARGLVPLQQVPDGVGGFLVAARKPTGADAVAKAA